MSNLNSMTTVFEKLTDLKNIFKFGERIVPVIQSLIEFMRDIVPLLENINLSIADSTRKIPQAANQIQNVTSATELATTEILDLVDEITNILTGIESQAVDFFKDINERVSSYEKLKEMFKDNEEVLSLVEKISPSKAAELQKTNILENIAKIKADSYQITLSLQVQDITAQQLASVNHLIESVHSKLSSLIQDIDQADLNADIKGIVMETPEGVVFDPNASYSNKEERQKEIDVLVNQSIKTTQEEVDNLFK
jgi:chemotaxis regulatin CheY-phosphate phosphatase CheZ